MGIQTYPPTSGTVEVIHSGPRDGDAWLSTLAASEEGHTVPATTFTFDITGTDLDGLMPLVQVTKLSGEVVYPEITVTDTSVMVSFANPVDPVDFQIKVVG